MVNVPDGCTKFVPIPWAHALRAAGVLSAHKDVVNTPARSAAWLIPGRACARVAPKGIEDTQLAPRGKVKKLVVIAIPRRAAGCTNPFIRSVSASMSVQVSRNDKAAPLRNTRTGSS